MDKLSRSASLMGLARSSSAAGCWSARAAGCSPLCARDLVKPLYRGISGVLQCLLC
jgi:hypothetical protein